MLPTIDVTVGATATATATAASAAAPPSRRADGERGPEAYRSPRAAPEKPGGADAVQRRTEATGEGAAAAAAPEKKPAEATEKKTSGRLPQRGDSVDIALQLSREERDALASAFGGDDERERMTPEEKETAQKASERITRYLDEAIARKRESRERMEKAVTEWYSRLSKGTDFGPTDLIGLFRQAAAGQLDDVTASGA